jgi:hypothetical protein
LHTALEGFIYKNGPPNVRELLAKQAQATRIRLDSSDICHGRDFPLFEQMFEDLTSVDATAEILESLKTPKDPMEGDCL